MRPWLAAAPRLTDTSILGASMDTPETMWRVGARFLRLVLILDALIIAVVAGWTLLDGSTSPAAIERGIWIVTAVIAAMWLVSQLGAAPVAFIAPGFINFPQFGSQAERASQRSFEMTWLTIAILATLSLVGLAIRVVYP